MYLLNIYIYIHHPLTGSRITSEHTHHGTGKGQHGRVLRGGVGWGSGDMSRQQATVRWGTSILMTKDHLPRSKARALPLTGEPSSLEMIVLVVTLTRGYVWHTLHYITLHYITLHYTTLNYIAFTFKFTLHYEYITSTLYTYFWF